MKVSDHVGEGKMVHFLHYQEGELWYKTDSGFQFPVPISDTGNAIFLKEDRSVYFMRWVRKHIKTIEDAKAEQSVND